MNTRTWLNFIRVAVLSVFFVFSLFSVISLVSPELTPDVSANQNCNNATATTPTWNPFPLNLVDPNPQPNGRCEDIPIMSHFPILNGNPRERSYAANETVTVHLYYNNGAQVSAANNIMQNPRARIELTRVSDTQYRARGILSSASSNVDSSQAQYGGDLIINVPAGTELQQVRRNTLWYPQAPLRFRNFNQGQNVQTNLNIDSDINTPNQLLTTNGFQIYTPTQSAISQQASAGLQAGFDESGYFLTAWRVVPVQAPVNNPPVLPGQEITIIRGETGAFQPVQGTDPENDVPLTYTPNDLPSFCSWNASTRIVTCQTNAQTPVRSTFTITPTDSRGLVGTPGTFIVNVIEPGLNLTKVCTVAGSSTPCSSSPLRPGDSVTYTLTVSNSGQAPARNVVVVDDYDESLLTDVRNINPASVSGVPTGTLRWELGTLNAGQSRTITYDATIINGAANGRIVTNSATATADNVPPRQASTSFPIGVQSPLLSQSDKVCFRRGTSTNCNSTPLTIGDNVTYFINVRNTGSAPAENVVVVDTYDRTRLSSITGVQPNGTVDTNAGTIRWELGRINPGETRTLTFEATISSNVRNGDIIVNTARISASNLPPQDVTVQFPVGIPQTVTQLDRTGGIAFFMLAFGALLVGGGVYYYKKLQPKTSSSFVPPRSSEAEIEPNTEDEKKVSKRKEEAEK